jgi:hypothetical protein
MADKFYSVILGEHFPSQVTEGSSTSSEAVEVRVSDSIYSNKVAVLNGLEAIKNYLITKETNPIA